MKISIFFVLILVCSLGYANNNRISKTNNGEENNLKECAQYLYSLDDFMNVIAPNKKKVGGLTCKKNNEDYECEVREMNSVNWKLFEAMRDLGDKSQLKLEHFTSDPDHAFSRYKLKCLYCTANIKIPEGTKDKLRFVNNLELYSKHFDEENVECEIFGSEL